MFSFLRRVSLLGVYAGLLTPLFYLPWVWHGFVSGKVWLFQAVVALSVPAWCFLAWHDKSFRPPRSVGVLAVSAQGGITALSTLFGTDVHQSFFGATDRMEGLLTQLHLFLWFLMALSLWKNREQLAFALHLSLGVGTAVAVLGLLQLPFPRILGDLASERISSTLGNATFLGAYLLQVLCLGSLAYSTWPKKAVGIVARVLVLAALFFTGSRGAFLALLVTPLLVWISYAVYTGRRRWVLIGMGAGLCLGLSVLGWAQRPHAASSSQISRVGVLHLLKTGDLEKRLSLWNVALEAAKARPLLGFGPGNFESAYQQHFHASEGCWMRSMNDAHNVVLQKLVTQGALGLGASIFLLAVYAWRLHRSVKDKRMSFKEGALSWGFLFASHLPLFFNPDTLSTQATFYFFLAWLEVRTGLSESAPQTTSLHFSWIQAAPCFLLSMAWLVGTSLLPVLASHHALKGMQAFRRTQKFSEPWRHFQVARALPTPYLEETLILGSGLLLGAADTGKAHALTFWEKPVQDTQEVALSYFRHHTRVRIRTLWLNALYAAGEAAHHVPWRQQAEEGFAQMAQENPKRQEVQFAYAQVLAKEQKREEAEKTLRGAVTQAPSIGESHFQLGLFLQTFQGLQQEGALEIQAGVHSVCPFWGTNALEMRQVAQGLWVQKDREALAHLARAVKHNPMSDHVSSYLLLADYLEQLELHEERNQVLEVTQRLLPNQAASIRQVLEGKLSAHELWEALGLGGRVIPPEGN